MLAPAADGYRVERDAHRGVPVVYACRDPRTGTLWACLDHEHWGPKMSRSTDDGVTWEDSTAPVYPKGAEIRAGVPATTAYIWCMAFGSDAQPGRLYLGTQPGGLFVSDDDGASWVLNEALWNVPHRAQWFGGGRDEAAIHSILVDPRDHDRVLIAISCAGVMETRDGGASWEPRNEGLRADFLPDPSSAVGQDPHLVVRSLTNPDVLWQQNHCGLWRSNDAAQSWVEVGEKGGPANFGFAIAVDEADAETAWVVPATNDDDRYACDLALCVCRTSDGGQTWTAHRDGLPQDDVYDIAYRHALDVDGDRLVFGTTTGNVYASVDRGERWALVSANFPMVHSVRFA